MGDWDEIWGRMRWKLWKKEKWEKRIKINEKQDMVHMKWKGYNILRKRRKGGKKCVVPVRCGAFFVKNWAKKVAECTCQILKNILKLL